MWYNFVEYFKRTSSKFFVYSNVYQWIDKSIEITQYIDDIKQLDERNLFISHVKQPYVDEKRKIADDKSADDDRKSFCRLVLASDSIQFTFESVINFPRMSLGDLEDPAINDNHYEKWKEKTCKAGGDEIFLCEEATVIHVEFTNWYPGRQHYEKRVNPH